MHMQALAQAALSLFASHATRLLGERSGYLVEMTGSGLCLAAFARPLDAIMWGVSLIEALKNAAWDEDLLAHEVRPQGDKKGNPMAVFGIGFMAELPCALPGWGGS